MLNLRSFQLEDLPLESMERVHYVSAATKRANRMGRELARKLYCDDSYYYKVWSETYQVHRIVYAHGQPVLVNTDRNNAEQLLGIQCRLYNNDTCPALVGHIYSRSGNLRGYVCHKGSVVEKQDMGSPKILDFIKRLISASFDADHILRDIHNGNLIYLPDGRVSLIDFETPLAHIYTLDLNEEVQSGSLRRGNAPLYRRFVLDLFDVRAESEYAVIAKERLKAKPVSQLLASGGVPVRTGSYQEILEQTMPVTTEPSPRALSPVQEWISSVEATLRKF